MHPAGFLRVGFPRGPSLSLSLTRQRLANSFRPRGGNRSLSLSFAPSFFHPFFSRSIYLFTTVAIKPIVCGRKKKGNLNINQPAPPSFDCHACFFSPSKFFSSLHPPLFHHQRTLVPRSSQTEVYTDYLIPLEAERQNGESLGDVPQ